METIESRFTPTKNGKPYLAGEGWFLILNKHHTIVRDKREYAGNVCVNTDQVKSEMRKFLSPDELKALINLISEYMEGAKIWDGQKFLMKTEQES